LQQVERWLAGATTNPNEASRKVKLMKVCVHDAGRTFTAAGSIVVLVGSDARCHLPTM
jgi:hypothetical protein